jgi:hypothetical protein
MTYTYDDLKAMTVAELRQIASGLQPALQGYTQMNKEHLLPGICRVLGVDTHHHHHHHAPRPAADVFDKAAAKAMLRTLKAERDKALEEQDGDALHHIRRRMHAIKRRIKVATY